MIQHNTYYLTQLYSPMKKKNPNRQRWIKLKGSDFNSQSTTDLLTKHDSNVPIDFHTFVIS